METTQASRLRKNWIVCFQPIKFEKIMDQSIRDKQAAASALWRNMTRQSHPAVEYFTFSENARVSAAISRITKAEGFLCFKEKNLKCRKVIK